MHHRITNNKFIANLMFSLLVAMAASAYAGNGIDRQLPQYSLHLADAQANPWALPTKPENTPGFQRPQQYRYQQYPKKQTETQYPGYRFVTPDILESLKQQQMQTQRGPDNNSNRQYRPQQAMPPQLMQRPSMQGYYGYPPAGGMGFSNPLYDTPAVSPWGNAADMLYQGQSLPWLPDAAIGGIPPIQIQPFSENNEINEEENGYKRNQNNVFNPFTFGPNGNL